MCHTCVSLHTYCSSLWSFGLSLRFPLHPARSGMPLAFLYNRKYEEGEPDSFTEALRGTGYVCAGECVQLYIMSKDVDIEAANSRADGCVGVLAVSVLETADVVASALPTKIPTLNSVLAVLSACELPLGLESPLNLFKVDWSPNQREVFECLLKCSEVHSNGASKSAKKHAGQAQHTLKLEIRALEGEAAQRPKGCIFGAPPFQLVQDYLGTLDPDSQWSSATEWMTDPLSEAKQLHTLNPGWSQELKCLLPVLRRALKGHLLRTLQDCRIQYVRSARMLSDTADEEATRVLLSVDRSGLPQGANPKHCLVLVASLNEVYGMLKWKSGFDLEHISSLHFVVGQSPDLRVLRLMPPVLKKENTTYLLVVFLSAQHDVYFAYECLRQSSLKLTTCANDDEFLALRAWCGQQSSSQVSLLDVFGRPGDRSSHIDIAEHLLKKTFSADQRAILNRLHGPLSVISCVAGAGKTVLLQALLAMAYHEIFEEKRTDLYVTYAASTQELAQRTLAEFREVFPGDERLRAAWALGFDRKRFVDLLHEQVSNMPEMSTEGLQIADDLSVTVTMIWHAYGELRPHIEDPAQVQEVADQVLALCLHVLALQHTYCDKIYYVAAHEKQQEVQTMMRIRFCTMDYHLKSRSGVSRPLQDFPDSQHLLIVDEFEDIQAYKFGACCGHDDGAVILAGDPQQTFAEARKQQLGGENENVSRWLRKCKSADFYSFNKSRRIAPPMSDYMTQIFPDITTFKTSRKPGEKTLLLPMLFQVHDYDLPNDEDVEIGHEKACFSHLLFFLCQELLRCVDGQNPRIAVVCMLLAVRDHVTVFLRWTLPRAMERLRQQLRLQPFPAKFSGFDFDTLVQMEYLSVIGPFAVRGFTYEVCFWLGLRRRIMDATWQGLILLWNILYVHFTRASARLYILLEDLCDGIRFPATGQLHRKALRLGLPKTNAESDLTEDSNTRRLLFLANFTLVCKKAFAALTAGVKCVKDEDILVTLESVTRAPALLESAEVRDAIKLRFGGPPESQMFLRYCLDSYGDMQMWWPVSASPRMDTSIVQRKDDWQFWNQIAWQADCRSDISTSSARSPWSSVHQFRRHTAAADLGVDSEIEVTDALHDSNCGPSDPEIVAYWSKHAIDAISVHIQGKTKCLVTVPVAAQPLCQAPCDASQDSERSRPDDLMWLARLLAHETSLEMQANGSWEKLEQHHDCKLVDRDVLHKWMAEEFGNELVYVRQCHSIRVAYTTQTVKTGSEKELAHIYCAMGLRKQSDYQQIILGRFDSLSIAAHFLAVAVKTLKVQFRSELFSVLQCMTDANIRRARETFLNVAMGICGLEMLETSRLSFETDSFPSPHVDSGSSDEALMNNLQSVRKVLEHLRVMGDTIIQDIALPTIDTLEALIAIRADAPEAPKPSEPTLRFEYEVRRARTHPTLLRPHEEAWRGQLYLGSLSAAVSLQWLQWARVTHVVSVLGKFQGQDNISTEWQAAQNNRWKSIQYLDWPVNMETKRSSWREVFGLIADALEISSNVVLVHCKNGKDRSAFTVYAFLRLLRNFSHQAAVNLVSQRLSTDGEPLFRYENQNHELTEWLEQVSTCSVAPESGVLSWRRGTL